MTVEGLFTKFYCTEVSMRKTVSAMVHFFSQLVDFFASLDPLVLLSIEMLFCFLSIILFLTFFGPAGLFIYSAIAIIAANCQVLKVVDFSFFSAPVVLGTVLFSSIYLATDILVEYYGERVARLSVYLGFAAFAFWVMVMLLTIGYKPSVISMAEDNAIRTLFLPMPAFFIAGMTAYLTSQLYDISIFQFIKKRTHGKYLWFRNLSSTLIASLIDNTIFSVLAFVVLAPTPLPWESVIYTYILGTFAFRAVMALLDTPFLYLARYAIVCHETHFKHRFSR